MTFQYLPGKRPRQTVYFENIVNNFIFIDEETAPAGAAQDAPAAAVSEQKPKGNGNTEVENDVNAAQAEAEDRLATVKQVKTIHENAATNEQFQLTMGSTELDYDRNEFSTPQKVHSESI